MFLVRYFTSLLGDPDGFDGRGKVARYALAGALYLGFGSTAVAILVSLFTFPFLPQTAWGLPYWMIGSSAWTFFTHGMLLGLFLGMICGAARIPLWVPLSAALCGQLVLSGGGWALILANATDAQDWFTYGAWTVLPTLGGMVGSVLAGMAWPAVWEHWHDHQALREARVQAIIDKMEPPEDAGPAGALLHEGRPLQ